MPLTTLLQRVELASQRGVMLLEALISIAIFSIGVLGLVGLQAAAIKNAGEARQRAAAAFYANQIIGQMWSDAANVASYKHKEGGDPPSSTACSFSGATSIKDEVKDWAEAIENDLSGAAADRQQITVSADKVVTVTLCWKNPDEAVFHWFTTVAQITQG